MVMLPEARTPPGLRIYAIGDIHGHLALIEEMHARIARDRARRPAQDWCVIHVGDYVDRGPESRGVIAYLIRMAEDPRFRFLAGNHDRFMRDALTGPAAMLGRWTSDNLGGAATLRSYGVDPGAPPAEMQEAFIRAVPATHRAFVSDLEVMIRLGDYAFAHAGVRPGVALGNQDEEDLIWIREPFLRSDEDLGAVVVHGHTPASAVEVRRNRIGIDTGAAYGGPLSCVVLEGPDRALLAEDGPESLGI